MDHPIQTIATKKRICSLCEAGCGLIISVADEKVLSISANQDDVFSAGHMCPKGVSLKELHDDPDRLKKPLIRDGNTHREVEWDEAFEFIKNRLKTLKSDSKKNKTVSAIYIGNPAIHKIDILLSLGTLIGSMKISQIYSSASVDIMPKQLASELMFGDDMAIPVPDILNCDYLLMLGANPIVSNGSLWMVPKFRDKLRTFRQRGGRLVVIDPRKSETANLADDHHFITPGTDVWLLSAIINELQLLGCEVPYLYGSQNSELLFQALKGITLEDAASYTGISKQAIQKISRDLLAAKHAAVYGRIGTTLQVFGTLTSFLIEVVNVITGNLDSQGGAMFPEQIFAKPGVSNGALQYNRFQSRVSGYPEVLGQFPVAALAEEIETEGPGQIKVLISLAGNPVVSHPDSDRLEAALSSLDFFVCVDIYHNETTKLADVILPGTSPFEDGHYDMFIGANGYKNTARYSPRIFKPTGPDEWLVNLTLAYIAINDAVPDEAELLDFENTIVAQTVDFYCADPHGPLFNRDSTEIIQMIGPKRGAERLLDLGIRYGRWGDHFGQKEGITLQKLIDEPNGIELGAIRSGRLSEILKRPLDLGPEVILGDIKRMLGQKRTVKAQNTYQLIARRNIVTNNSWLRNLPMLTRGRDLVVLEMNPSDAAGQKIHSGDKVRLSTKVAKFEVVVAVSEVVARGVISLPFGFSEDTKMFQRIGKKGVNYNRLLAAGRVDALSGTSATNGVEVILEKIE